MNGVAISDVARSFDGRAVLGGVDLECPPGSITVIMGASGSGKTTLLRLIAGLIAPDRGAIAFNGRSLASMRLSYMPQGDTLLPWLSVLENVLAPLRVGRARTRIGEAQQSSALALLQDMGLEAYARHAPAQLSGGMRQRVALARSFISDPEIALLDEPFSALDEPTRRLLETKLLALVRARNVSCVFVTHSIDQALSIGDRIHLLRGAPAKLELAAAIAREERPLTAVGYGELRQKLSDAIHV